MSRFFERTLPPLAVLIAASVLFFLTAPIAVNLYDEGLILTGAIRVLNGEWPSRDFYANYGPAQFFVVAGLFKVFGTSLPVSRLYDAVVAGSVVTSAYVATRSIRSRGVAIGCTLIVCYLLVRYRVDLYPITPAIALIVFSGALLAQILKFPNSTNNFFIIIFLLVALFLLRYDLGLLGIVALWAPMAIVSIFDIWHGKSTFRERSHRIFVNSAFLFGSFAFAIAVLAASGIAKPAFIDIIQYNLATYAKMRSLPFPGIRYFILYPIRFTVIYLPIIATVIGLLTIFWPPNFKARTSYLFTERRSHSISILIFSFISGVFYIKGIVRVSPEHMLIACVPAVILIGLLFDRFIYETTGKYSRMANRAIAIAVIVFPALALFTFWHSRNIVSNITLYLNGQTKLPIPSLSFYQARPTVLEAAEYVKSVTHLEERILSATGRHDKIFVNDLSLYFMTERLPATRWHHYDPGVQTTEPVQREIIHDLERHGVQYLIVDSTFDGASEKNESAISSGVTLLDEYIRRHYQPVRVFGPIGVWRRTSPNPNATTPANPE